MTNSLSTIPINRLNPNELNEKINTSVEEKANIDLSNTPFANLENVDGTLTWDGNALLKSSDVDTSSFANTSASNFTTTGKTTIVGWGIPDYSAGVALSEGGTVGKNSVIYVKGVASEGKSVLTLYINGVEVGSNSSYGNSQTVSCYAIAKSGAKITTSRAQIASYTIKYFPLMGVK